MKNEIENAIIKSADLSIADHGSLTMYLHIEGNGWECMLGGYCLGHGYLGAKEFDSSPKGIEEIMRIMDVVGVDKFSKLTGKYIRVEKTEWAALLKSLVTL